MLDVLTTEALLSLATVGVSGLAACGTLVALRATRHRTAEVDMDALMKNAPLHRLHNVVQVKGA